MIGNKVVGVIVEVLMLIMIGLICIKVHSGDPASANYSDYVMVPFVYAYLGFYALKIIFNRSSSNLKYLFYFAFGVLILGVRFYVNVDLVGSIK